MLVAGVTASGMNMCPGAYIDLVAGFYRFSPECSQCIPIC